jgi:hypothetical protein
MKVAVAIEVVVEAEVVVVVDWMKRTLSWWRTEFLRKAHQLYLTWLEGERGD